MGALHLVALIDVLNTHPRPASIEHLARMARVPLSECEREIERLERAEQVKHYTILDTRTKLSRAYYELVRHTTA